MRVSLFGVVLAILILLGLAIRLIYALAVAPGQVVPGDAHIYHDLARQLAHGRGYTLGIFHGAPTASHPPLYPLYLAALTKLGLTSLAAQRAGTCLAGAAAVALIGLLGRRVAGPRVGLIAAAGAAIYPQLFMVDGTLIADALYVPVVVLALLLAYRFIDEPTPARAAPLGAAIGLAALTRSDGLLLFALLALPLAWRAGRGRLRLMAVVAASTALVLAPWLVRNWVRFDRFPLVSTNGALTQPSTNCRATYYGRRVGFVAHECALRSPCLRIRKEIPQSDCYLRQARRYARRHLGRLPIVVLARIAREWNVYAPALDRSYGLIWGRQWRTATAGMAMYALLVPLGLYGALLLRRRRVLLPLLATFGVAILTAVIAFGFSRYRVAAEPALVVLGAVGAEALFKQPRRRAARHHRPRVEAPSRS